MQDSASNPQKTVRVIAALLEYWLLSSAVRLDRSARPVVFRFLVKERLALSFVPAGQGPLIREGAYEGAVLTVHAHPNALLKLLTEPDADVSEFATWVEGDPTALDAIVRALRSSKERKSVIGIRASEGGSSS
jgi:hypothetical protein